MISDEERAALLRAAHASLTAELLTLRHEMRQHTARMKVILRQLADIERSTRELARAGFPQARSTGS
ncbi:MAG TPA: hypothetical protein VN255_08980 [Mycobacterium sp.]|nr:hypothetical protein [Mycobacterium sp.]HWT48690.1 hypothetical protein [Mycobacterium sp.]